MRVRLGRRAKRRSGTYVFAKAPIEGVDGLGIREEGEGSGEKEDGQYSTEDIHGQSAARPEDEKEEEDPQD